MNKHSKVQQEMIVFKVQKYTPSIGERCLKVHA